MCPVFPYNKYIVKMYLQLCQKSFVVLVPWLGHNFESSLNFFQFYFVKIDYTLILWFDNIFRFAYLLKASSVEVEYLQ